MRETTIYGFTHPDYENVRVLNRLGGTGDLFAAHKKGLNIDVVIKRTQPRFRHVLQQESEATILKSLKHQYLPRIYDVIYGQDGCIYTVMDLISGQNLQQYIEKMDRSLKRSVGGGLASSARWCSICIRKTGKSLQSSTATSSPAM